MSQYLIDLENFSYEDYIDTTIYMNEMFLTEASQSYTIERLVDKLKSINDKLDKQDFDNISKAELEDLLTDIETSSKEVQIGNLNKYTAIKTVTQIIKILDTVISISKVVKKLIDKHKKALEVINNLPLDKSKELAEDPDKFKAFYKSITKDPRDLKTKIKDSIKDFFTIKNLIIKGLNTINNMLNKYSKKQIGYESTIDKMYEILLNCEAKMMMEKRKAKQEKDTHTEGNCDKVIEFIEKIKKDRLRSREEDLRNNPINEALINQDKVEFKATTFKLVCRDIADAIKIEKDNLRSYCDTAIYVIRRALEITDDNKDNKLDLIEKKIKKNTDYIRDINRTYDTNTLNTLLMKYGQMYSTKYSTFGLKAKEEFESRLKEEAKDICNIWNKYMTTLGSLVGIKTDKYNIVNILDLLEEKMMKKSNRATYMNIKRILSDLDNDSYRKLQECSEYVNWCIKNVDTKIKDTLKFKIMNKLFK